MGRFVPANSEMGRRFVRIDGRYRSKYQPHQGTKERAKKYAEFDSCGRKTLGRVK
jgi:hypothetical protein